MFILLALDNRPCSYKYFYYICKALNIQNQIFFHRNDVLKFLDSANFIISFDNFIFDGIVKSRDLDSYKKENKIELVNSLVSFIQSQRKSNFYVYISIPRLLLNFKKEISQILQMYRNLFNNVQNSIDYLPNFYDEKIKYARSYLESYILRVRYEKLKLIEFFLDRTKDLKNVNITFVLDDSQIRSLNFLELKYLKKKYRMVNYLIGLDEVHLLILAKIIAGDSVGEISFSSNFDVKYKRSIYEGTSLRNILKIYSSYLGVDFKRKEDSVFYWNIFSSFKQREANVQLADFNNFDNFVDWFLKSNDLKYQDLELQDLTIGNSFFNYFVDLSFANGASLKVLKYFLVNWDKLLRLLGFWSWNTLANSLGSAIAQYIIFQTRRIENRDIVKLFVLENFLESLYQTVIRHFASGQNWNLSQIKEAFSKILSSFGITLNFDICLPWQRYFEIDIKVKRLI